jgi:predicted nucleic acid-binding protein
MQINLPASLFHPGLKTRGYQAPGLLRVQVAARYGLRVQGVLGVLLRAKDRGLIPLVRPLLDALVNDAGFWITNNLYQRVLQIARE